MGKPKAPILSLGARGSIGKAITFQDLGRIPIVRSRPTPVDPYTLPQAYQRWTYHDYAYLWTQQSSATKQHHSTAGSRYHLTGFQHWMRYCLRHLQYLLACYRMDLHSGPLSPDSSPYQTHATIFGATQADGPISHALHFITDDYLQATTPQLNFTSEDFSILFFFRCDSLSTNRDLVNRGAYQVDGWMIRLYAAGHLFLWTNQVGASQASGLAVGTVQPGVLYHIGFARSGSSVTTYLNGLNHSDFTGNHQNPLSTTRFLRIGSNPYVTGFFHNGIIDQLEFYNRTLTPAEFFSHAHRRYPPQ